ncbi:MAG TPA: methyltransferase, FxLD system [Trebonia sp.]|nr:methyltransferase, FxLD system [Trebonia sp.]
MATQADRLRHALVDQLRQAGAVCAPRVEAAMRAVPRHVFVPGAPLRRAYADDVVQTKLDSDGTPISAASQPSIVAVMLEQLAVAPGMRVLEIGAGTGYNAALLAHLAGDDGSVVTLDVDDDIVDGARAALGEAGFPGVTVVREDGALGYAPSAPYDRIVATVGARDVPLAWQDQLAPDGRLVVPLRLRGGVTRSVAFEHARETGPELRSVSSVMCGFMPMRASIASDERQTLPLTRSGNVLLEVHQEQRDSVDPDALDGVFDTERVAVRTGVRFGDAVSAEWLFLWLTCTLNLGLFRMQVAQSAIDAGVVAPLFRWGAVGAIEDGSLAYLSLGPAGESGNSGTTDAADSDAGREVEVVGHGPRGPDLAETITERIRAWDTNYRTRTARFEIWPTGMASSPALKAREDLFVFPTPANTLVVSWQGESETLHQPTRTSAISPV